MREIQIDWEEFVNRSGRKSIKPLVDINKGHALMKSPFAPKNWKFAINLLSTISLLAIPSAIVLFFFLKWWIPIVIIILSLLTIKAIREEAAKAVIATSLLDSEFYYHAIHSETMKIFIDESQDEVVISQQIK